MKSLGVLAAATCGCANGNGAGWIIASIGGNLTNEWPLDRWVIVERKNEREGQSLASAGERLEQELLLV